MKKQESSDDSNYEDSTIADLNQNDFSISISEAKKVASQETKASSYFSYLAPAVSSTYVAYVIETQSRLPGYSSQNKIH
jgi:hypothetical protein